MLLFSSSTPPPISNVARTCDTFEDALNTFLNIVLGSGGPISLKGVLHLWALFLKTLCIFSKNKATSDKVSYGSGQKCSKELKNHSFTSVETIVVKLQ